MAGKQVEMLGSWGDARRDWKAVVGRGGSVPGGRGLWSNRLRGRSHRSIGIYLYAQDSAGGGSGNRLSPSS